MHVGASKKSETDRLSKPKLGIQRNAKCVNIQFSLPGKSRFGGAAVLHTGILPLIRKIFIAQFDLGPKAKVFA